MWVFCLMGPTWNGLQNKDKKMSNRQLNTLALHAGQETPDSATGARAVPIYQTTSYVFDSADHAARLFALQENGHIYTRLGNPTTEILEHRLAQLDGGVGALALSSGQAAITAAVLNITRAGQNIVSTRSLYGGTYNLFHYTLPKMGIEVKFVNSSDPENVRAAIDENTRLVALASCHFISGFRLEYEEIGRQLKTGNPDRIIAPTQLFEMAFDRSGEFSDPGCSGSGSRWVSSECSSPSSGAVSTLHDESSGSTQASRCRRLLLCRTQPGWLTAHPSSML